MEGLIEEGRHVGETEDKEEAEGGGIGNEGGERGARRGEELAERARQGWEDREGERDRLGREISGVSKASFSSLSLFLLSFSGLLYSLLPTTFHPTASFPVFFLSFANSHRSACVHFFFRFFRVPRPYSFIFLLSSFL